MGTFNAAAAARIQEPISGVPGAKDGDGEKCLGDPGAEAANGESSHTDLSGSSGDTR